MLSVPVPSYSSLCFEVFSFFCSTAWCKLVHFVRLIFVIVWFGLRCEWGEDKFISLFFLHDEIEVPQILTPPTKQVSDMHLWVMFLGIVQDLNELPKTMQEFQQLNLKSVFVSNPTIHSMIACNSSKFFFSAVFAAKIEVWRLSSFFDWRRFVGSTWFCA